MTKGREAIYIEPNNMAQIERMRRYYQMIAKQTGRSVRPFRGDGYVNLVTQLGNNRNNQAPVYRPELLPSDTELAALYEGSGLFSKIIDAPAEEAIKHGFELQDVTDAKINDFISEALDELEWENTAATAIKWSRLFGGSIIVMLVDDGRGIDEPLDWKNIKSIDELRVFERAIVVPDETSMYRYVPGNPLGGNRYGEPEFYTVSSRYGYFNVHESRCLVFRNGRVPEFSANSIYQLWGIPEYVRMKQALANSELAYGSAPKMLERCVQAVYKMKNLAEELSTEDGEQNVLKRLEVIDLARGLLNSIAIDNEGEDYDFKTFSFTGVADVIDSTCNMLSAVSNIPQTILFGRSPAGMNATGTSDLENWYNYIERVQKTQVKKNLRYLLSVIFQAGMYHGEIDEIPKIKISFNPLWSLSEQDKANVDKVKADTELVRANTANLYIQAEVISSDEVRSALAKTDEFDIETMLDDMEDDENLMTSIHDPVNDPDGGEGEENSGADVTDNTDPTAPDATKNLAESAKANLPTEPKRSDGNDYDDFPEYGMWLEEHMEATREEQKAAEEHYKALKKAGNRQHSNRDNQSTKEQKTGGVGVIVVKEGKILCGKRHNDTGYGLLCGPGGHVEQGETAEQAAIRETQEEFGITPKNIIRLGDGPKEPETGIAPAIFLCTEYDGEPECDDLEMVAPQFMSLDELEAKSAEQFQPFKDGIVVLLNCLNMNHDGDSAFFGGELNSIKPGSYDVMRPDGGEGSGNFGHKGRPGEIGGSAESHQLGGMKNGELASKMKDVFGKAKVGTHFSIQMEGPVGKEAYEAFKTSDGYYLRSKKGSNKIISSDDKLVEGCGVYVVEATKNRTMYKKADIQIGEPETDEAKKFAEDYASFQKAKERLQAGETQISEVSDDVAKQYADTLNKASKGKIAKIAAEDPQFKAVVDNISAYTQGEYIFQRKTVEGVVENGYDPSKDAILGDRLTDSAFSCKDMYQGQNLSVSSASVAEGMTNLSKAVKCSEPYEGELYRVAQDRSILFEQDSGRQGVYVPPTVGETIKITAPTSFSKDRAAVDKIAKDKMGDIIYYTVEPGAHAVDVSKLSPYKQAELLSCGDYEVVKVESEPRTALWDREDKFTSETLETLKQYRGATVSDGYVTYPVLTTHITLRQTSSQNSDSADDNRTPYRLDDFSERMVQSTETDGGSGSGNFGHAGVPGQVGGSAPAGAASSAASAEKVSTLKENFGNLKQNQKYAYLGRTGIVPKGELDSLKAGVASSDQKAIAKLAEYEETYFNLAEYGSEAKSLKVEMRDDVAAMSDEDAAAWAKQSMDRRLESHEGWANQYSAAQKVAIDMGVYETPQVVSQEDFDKYVKESGAAVCYRGVKDIDSMTGENMMFQMAYNTQEPYYGDGIFGDGLYFSTRKETAEGYAGRAAIATCAVRPDAKILEYGSPEHEKAKKRVQTTDDSVAALCSGYDVIHKKMGGNEDYYVILNRAALVMVDPVSKQGDLAIRAAQKNAGRSNGDSTRVSPENNMGNLDNRGKNATIKVQKTHTDGGLGSGNFGHAGRTGKVGGSASGESSIEVEGSSGKKAKMSIPAIDTGDAAAEVKNGRHNSLEKYIDSDGNLSPERQALHAEIVSGYFEGKEKVDGVRTATFLGGGPASGKSSLRDSGLIVQADDPSTVTIDPDGLKGKLPGYEEMASETDSAAAFYHEESSAVAKTLYSTALDYGCNTVYDGTGDGSVNSMRKKIKDAHDAGYKAVGEYVTVDVDEALRRNELRYEAAKEKYEKGLSKVPPRLPDAKIVKSIHRKVTDISVECASEFDSIKIYDNNGARGSAPTLIATGGNGKPLSAVNKPLLQKYLDKGEKKWKIDEKGEVVPG
jgi:phage-related protein (TIGR01555 family)